MEVFEAWMHEARQHPHIKEPTAMALATASPDGGIHARVVLCKQWSHLGFLFYSNYHSRKGLDLRTNPNAGAVFYWDPMFKQIKISGPVSMTSRKISEDYWRSRSRESQLSQFISRQSEEAPARESMEAARLAADEEYRGREIPCPGHWGGYLLKPERIEFWIGREGRFHDRYEFDKTSTLWTFRRLYP